MDNIASLPNGRAKGLAAARDEGRMVAFAALDVPSHFDGAYWLKNVLFEIGREPLSREIVVRTTADPIGTILGSIDLAFVSGMLWAAAELQAAIERDENGGDPPDLAA